MKKKIIILLLVIIFILATIGFSITYARYKTEMSKKNVNIAVAKFVFEDQYTNQIDLSLNTINPGEELTTEFQVVNNKTRSGGTNVRSEVVVEYNIVIETLFNLPLEFRLYKGTNTTATLTCTKSSATLNSGVYTCQTGTDQLGYTSNETSSYKIKISFPSTDTNGNTWPASIAGLSDYLKIKLNASQKM